MKLVLSGKDIFNFLLKIFAVVRWIQTLRLDDFCPKTFRTLLPEKDVVQFRPIGIEVRPIFKPEVFSDKFMKVRS